MAGISLIEDALEHASFWIDYYDPIPKLDGSLDYQTAAILHLNCEKMGIPDDWDGLVHLYIRQVMVSQGFLRPKKPVYQLFVGSIAEPNFITPTPKEVLLASHKSVALMADGLISGQIAYSSSGTSRPWPNKGLHQFTIRTFHADTLPSWNPDADAHLVQTIHFMPHLRMLPVAVTVERVENSRTQKWAVRVGDEREDLQHDDWVAASIRCTIASYVYARDRIDRMLQGLY